MKKITLFLGFFLFGCNSDFSPNGPYHPQFVVYAVIDGSVSTQIIRVYGTFNPVDYDPLQPSPNKEVHNAFVSVSDGQSTYIFHDTAIVVSDNNSANRTVHAYVNYGLQPVEKKKYTLTVAASGYDTTRAVISSISLGDILPGNINTLTKPGGEKTIPVRVNLGANVRAFLPMIYLEYEVQNDGIIRTKEVPVEVMKNTNGEVTKRNYPKISFRDASSNIVGVYETILFNTDAYIQTVTEIKSEHNGLNVKFLRALLVLVQFDNDLYTYYSVANNFAGEATLRLDEPDFTNIANGFGVFGMQSRQIKAYALPSDFK